MVVLIIISQKRQTTIKQCPHCFKKIEIPYNDIEIITKFFKTYKQAKEYLNKKLKELEKFGYAYEWYIFPSRYFYGYSQTGTPF